MQKHFLLILLLITSSLQQNSDSLNTQTSIEQGDASKLPQLPAPPISPTPQPISNGQNTP